MIVTQKSKQNSIVGARCIVPTGEIRQNIVRAQFIVLLQHDYN